MGIKALLTFFFFGVIVLKKKQTENRCPICNNPLKPGQRVCEGCQKVLDANPWLTVVDLM
jgi:predicted amidophosphoribosyltransferase